MHRSHTDTPMGEIRSPSRAHTYSTHWIHFPLFLDVVHWVTAVSQASMLTCLVK